jgi:hypothetical protein
LPRGINADEVVHLFGIDWELLWQRQAPEAPVPRFLAGADPTWYSLRRN